jgi:intracellular septation protein A
MVTNQDGEDTPPPRRDASPARVRDFMQIDASVFQGFLPAIVFLVANRLGPVQIAIILSFATAAWVFARNKSSGVIRMLSAVGFLLVALSTVIGLALNSDRAFVAQNIFADVVFAALFLGSVATRRPLIGAIARELVPGIRPVMHIGLPVFAQLSLVSAAINVVSAIVRYFMIESMSVDAYVILSRVVFIPVNIAFVVLCYVTITRTAIRIWPEDEPYEHLRRGPHRRPAASL